MLWVMNLYTRYRKIVNIFVKVGLKANLDNTKKFRRFIKMKVLAKGYTDPDNNFRGGKWSCWKRTNTKNNNPAVNGKLITLIN